MQISCSTEKDTESTESVTQADTKADDSGRGHFNLRVLLLPKFWLIGVAIFVYANGFSLAFQAVPALGHETGELMIVSFTIITCHANLERETSKTFWQLLKIIQYSFLYAG